MNIDTENKKNQRSMAYLTALGAWALAFGCAVGWGSFMMPGNTFLPIAGPIGTYIGMMLGAVVMMVIAANFHYLMNRYPDAGGTYTYTKKCFGYDHGLLSAWFLILTYIAIIWANASAIPLVARTLLGGMFQFGFHYQVAGFDVYFGEVMLAVLALVLSAAVCLRRKAAELSQIVMAVVLFGGIVICMMAAMMHTDIMRPFDPPFSPDYTPLGGVITIFALAPWAFVGFESITHSASEAKFSLKKSFGIMLVALITAGAAYAFLALLAVTALPEGCGTWVDYIKNLGEYSGVQSAPTFNAAYSALGNTGSIILGVAALCGMFTGLIGNYIALSRLMSALADDGMVMGFFGKRNDDLVPVNAIYITLAISVVFPFLGRTAISWIVDVTTVGATIAYAFASGAVWKAAKEEENKVFTVTGIAGVIISLLFAIEFLVPNLTTVQTLSTESYLILSLWGILGFITFRHILLHHDTEKRLGRSSVAWIVLLGLIIFTSSVWLLQSTGTIITQTMTDFEETYEEGTGLAAQMPMYDYLLAALKAINKSLLRDIFIQVGLIVAALAIMFNIYSITQKRERQTEIEKVLAENASKAKTSFLSNMSHEIRTPMNAIIGLDSIALRNPNLQPQTREQLEKIGASAKHLLGLINDILDMSRIESGRMVLKDEEFSIRELLDQVNIIINGQCQDKGLHYECRIAGRIRDYYYGDDMKLKQVMINILGNSVKFTEVPGSVTLTVEQVAEEDGICTLHFAMKDTGVGMDEEFIPKIFEAFAQEAATTTNKYGGSGLGMAITKSFVEMMGGDIQVESKKGVGSTFTVTVKLRASDRTFMEDENFVIPKGFKIAMVDDDEVSCDHARMVLKDIGATCDIFKDSMMALAEIHDAHDIGNDYDLVLTDYKMPVLNGLNLTKRIREFDGGKTAVIILTGYNWDIIEDEAINEGVDGILSKPIFADSLLREIHTVLLKRSGEEIAEPEEEISEAARDLAGKRVLMAEDVQQNAEILEDLLDLEDIEHEHALNGKIAVDMFSEHPVGYYDVILMDVRMPVMDGLTATETIRALDRPDAKTIPIIAMTANVFDEDVQRSREAGMDAHLAKPVEPEKMYETMTRLIEERENK